MQSLKQLREKDGSERIWKPQRLMEKSPNQQINKPTLWWNNAASGGNKLQKQI